MTASDLPLEVSSSTLIIVSADLEGLFKNGNWYLMAIDGLLIVWKVVEVIFDEEKGKFRLTDWDGEVDYLAGGGVGVTNCIGGPVRSNR